MMMTSPVGACSGSMQDVTIVGRRLLDLERLAGDQAARLGELSALHGALREEHEGLCGCIFAAGLVPPAALQARLSARRRPSNAGTTVLRETMAVPVQPQQWQNSTPVQAAHVPQVPGGSHPNSARRGPSRSVPLQGKGVTVVRTSHSLSEASPRGGDQQVMPAASAPTTSTGAAETVPAVPEGVQHLRTPGLYVVGGHASGCTLAAAERLDPETGRWEALPDMPTPRHGCASAAVIGILYVFGGANDSGLPLATAERYDPMVGCWERLPPLPTARHGSACAVASGVLYVLGGYDGEGVLAVAERFDPAANRWEILPPMPSSRGRCAAAAAEGLVFVAGGTDDDGRELSLAEQFDPMNRQWLALPPMPTPRCGCSAAVVAGSFFVVGGRCGSEKLNTVELYNLSSNAWECITPMPTPRDGCAAASLAGLLYVFGGRGVGQTLQSVERYNPAEGAWEGLTPMPKARCGLAAATADR
mmetsp:Transcript_534/g.1568  ORF Transcript_534/g.1568 Transcript_534/m.1568 type:complete len:475 (-) Transcript_534:352-1776(-)